MKDRPRRRTRKKGVYVGWTIVLLVVAVVTLALLFKDGLLRTLFPHAEVEVKSAGGQAQVAPWQGRRNIYDRNFRPLAVSYQLASLYARPLDLVEPGQAANQLAPLLGWQDDVLLHELKSNRGFIWLASRVPVATAEKVQALGLTGIHRVDEPLRYYPQRDRAAHVVGFQQDDQGLAGMESYYDAALRSENRVEPIPAAGHLQPSGGTTSGAGHVVLSLDLRIQAALEKSLDALRQQTTAGKAMGLIMDPRNGEILAMAIRPAFDPNSFWEFDVTRRRNELLRTPVFPGELTRIFRLAADLAAGVDSLATVEQEPGPTPEKTAVPASMTESSGVSPQAPAVRDWVIVQPGIFASQNVSQLPDATVREEALLGFATQLGFSKPSTIDLPLEDEREQDGVGAFRLDSRELPTSALKLLTTFSALVNGGREVKPHLLLAFWPDSSAEAEPVVAGEAPVVLDPRVSDAMRVKLASAGGKGAGDAIFFESLVADDYSLAAQDEALADLMADTPDESPKKFQWVTLGMAPSHEPEVVVLMVLDGASFDPMVPSPVRRAANGEIARILEHHREPPMTGESARLATEKAKVFEIWRKLRERAPGQEAPDDQAQVEQKKMPDVTGLSLRKALQRLQPCDLAITVTGAGRVVRQSPRAGDILAKGVCTLELRADQ